MLSIQSIQAQSVLTNTGNVYFTVDDGAVVTGDTVDNLDGNIYNNGWIYLFGHYNNQDFTSGNGLYELKGDWNNTGSFTPGTSKVKLIGDMDQEVINTAPTTFSRFELLHGGFFPGNRIWLRNSLDVSDSLIMRTGVIDIKPDGNVLTLSHPDTARLVYRSGRIIGKFRRALDRRNVYLYPIGSQFSYNPMYFRPNVSPTAGLLRAEFNRSEPGNAGLPLQDTLYEIFESLPFGYWSVVPDGAFSVNDYFVSLGAGGFNSAEIDSVSTIIKRDSLPGGAGDWQLDGVHRFTVLDSLSRDTLDDGVDGVSFLGIQFGIGKARPRIIEQPVNDTVCEFDPAFFSVKARGRRLNYEWQIWNGTEFVSLLDSTEHYSGADSPNLVIDSARLYMDGSQYRVVIKIGIGNSFGNAKISDTVTLFVEPLPEAQATPDRQIICNEAFTDIALTSDYPVDSFRIQVLYQGSDISGAVDETLDTDFTLAQLLTNSGTTGDSVVYRIVPYGSSSQRCEGIADTATVLVNPTPQLDVDITIPQLQDTLLCNEESIQFAIDSAVSTFGTVRYVLDITLSSANITNTIASGIARDVGILDDQLTNTSNTVQTATYTFTPFIENGSDNGDCGNGIPVQYTIYVNPTPGMNVSITDTLICNNVRALFDTDSTVSTLGTVRYRVEALYGDNITGEIGSIIVGDMGLASFTDSLVNSGNGVDTATYVFTPFIEGGTNRGIECPNGTQSVTLYINPTPSMTADIVDIFAGNDTIFCNNSEIWFELDSTVAGTTGRILYDLFISGNRTEVLGWQEGTGLDIQDFRDTLVHGESDIQRLYYSFEPWIDNAGAVPDCYDPSFDTLVEVAIVPTLEATIVSDSLGAFVGGNDIRCFGEFGSISVDPVGGDYRFFYNYEWMDSGGSPIGGSDGPTGQQKPVPSGEYSVLVTDTIGCTVTDNIVLYEPDLLTLLDTIMTEPDCPGQSTASIDVTMTGGVLGYDYFWQNLAVPVEIYYTEDVIDLGVGAFSFSVTDTNNCKYYTEFEISAPDEITLSTIRKEKYGRYDISCYGESDGEIEVKAEGGTGPYYFIWRNEAMDTLAEGPGVRTLSNQPAGKYYYKVIDDNGCTDYPEYMEDSLVQPDPIEFSKVNPTYPGGWDISCYGAEDGILDLDYTGGHILAGENTFTWTGPGIDAGNENDSILSELPPGEYSVQIVDSMGCANTYYDTLYQPDQIQYAFNASTDPAVYFGRDVKCYGDTSGYVLIDNVTGGGERGGSATYSYLWEVVESFPPGFVLADETSGDQEYLMAGEYNLTISDQIGCSVLANIVLDTTPRLSADVVVDNSSGTKNGFDVTCFGGSDGEVSFTPQGGTTDYTYYWDGSEITNQTVSGLTAGSYTLEIEDVNNCLATYDIGLSSPPQIIFGYDSAFIECYGGTEDININPDGGNDAGPYDFLWSLEGGGSATSEDLTGVPAGTYNVQITDINMCSVDSTIVLYQSPEIVIDLTIDSDYNGKFIRCFGDENGAISAVVSGGRESYEYRWIALPGNELPDQDADIENVGEGWYKLVITDFYDCEVTDSIFIEQPDPITLSTDVDTRDPLCDGDTTGRIGIIASGGAGGYWYNWGHDENLVGNIASGLVEGIYPVTVEDVNECFGTDTIELVAPEALSMEVETIMAECEDVEDGSISVTPEGGSFPYAITVEKPDGSVLNDNGSGTFDNLGPGTYIVTITDAHGCILINADVVVEAEFASCITMTNAFTPNDDGANDRWIIDDEGDGQSDMYLYPDAELRIYNRWGELIFYTNNVSGEPWDGTYKGRPMPIDSYYYILELNNGDPPITGNVTIIR